MSGLVLRGRCAPSMTGFLILASAALGAVYNWTGNSTSNGNWSTTLNWSTAGGLGYPGTSDDAVIVNSNHQPIAVVDTNDRTVRNLFVGNGRGVQLDNALTVALSPSVPGSGRLEFNGEVTIKRSTGSPKNLTAERMLVFSRDMETTTVATEASARIVVGA